MAQQKPEKQQESYVRIVGTDINAKSALLYGLTHIKGISFMLSNAICHTLKLEKTKKIADLSEKELEVIEKFLADPQFEGKIPAWLLNQRKDMTTGDDLHVVGKEIEFNLLQTRRHLSKLKTYRGLRLRLGLPVRGQRTKSNFRKNKTIAAMKAKTGGRK